MDEDTDNKVNTRARMLAFVPMRLCLVVYEHLASFTDIDQATLDLRRYTMLSRIISAFEERDFELLSEGCIQN